MKTVKQMILNRLFNEVLQLCTPIDYDKFINYENYYWYPSVTRRNCCYRIVENLLLMCFRCIYQDISITLAPDVVIVNGTVTADYETLGLKSDFANRES